MTLEAIARELNDRIAAEFARLSVPYERDDFYVNVYQGALFICDANAFERLEGVGGVIAADGIESNVRAWINAVHEIPKELLV